MERGRRYHLDCASGLAGDMFLGACLHLGMPLEVLTEVVAALGLEGVSVEARTARRGGIAGVRFRVLMDGEPIEGPDPEEDRDSSAKGSRTVERASHKHRHLSEIRRLLDDSGLAPAVKERSASLFVRLAEVEAKVHGVGVDEVHFHEVGAIDSIVDLVGAAAALEYLRPESLTAGAVVVGSGTVTTEHGEMPVPTPATAELLRGLPTRPGPPGELLTPTGALLLAELVDSFGAMASLEITGIGYGLGRREVPGRSNAVRLIEGRAWPDARRSAQVMVVECEIDDLSGEGLGFVLERLLEGGALDVFFTAVQMKKNRPGTLVTVLCRPDDLERLSALLLTESGSLGCRYYPTERFEAERESIQVETPFGVVSVKRARFCGRVVAEAPEFEDCRRLARSVDVTWREVYTAAIAALDRDRSKSD